MEPIKKRCLNCGALFILQSNRHNSQKYCSDKCKIDAKNKRDLASYRRIYKNIDEYIGDEIYSKEEKRRGLPSHEDIEDTLLILKDFGVGVKKKNIPKFSTYAELEHWKNQQISGALS